MTREEAISKINETIDAYFPEGNVKSCEPYGNGHINDTFLVVANKQRYILQRINHIVFPRPDEIMENILGVTEHIRNNARKSGKDFERAMEGSSVRTEIERLRTYMQNGGKVYVAIDPYGEKLHVLESFLAEFGISISETVNSDGKILRNIVRDTRNSVSTDNFTLVADFADSQTAGKISDTVSKYTGKGVKIEECAALNISGSAEAVIVSS